ncbi:MAG: BNR-4 repeat-containing protein [Bacteroidota bacterium]
MKQNLLLFVRPQVWQQKILVLVLGVLLTQQSVAQQVTLTEETTVTNDGLYFWYPNGKKAFQYAANISPRGDCFTVANGYIFFGWYKGGMNNRNLMISRKKIGSGSWKTVQFPYTNTLIQGQGPNNFFGDSHNTISVGVSTKDGTIHIFYDHHNDPLKYVISKKDKAFVPDNQFNSSIFNSTRGYLAQGENIRITYPELTENAAGDLIVNYRKGSAVGGSEMVHVYNGNTWSRAKQVTRGAGNGVAQNDRNYAYGNPVFSNGDVYYAFSVRWARKKQEGVLNEGVYLAKCGPDFLGQWEDPNGVRHPLPIQDFSPFLIDNPTTLNGGGANSGPSVAVSANGDVHVGYKSRGNNTNYWYTYTRKAGQSQFTKHTRNFDAGHAWGNRMYRVRLSNGKITVLSTAVGSVNYRTDREINTGRAFGEYEVKLEDGYLILFVEDRSVQTDSQKIYCYTFQIGNGGGNTGGGSGNPTVNMTAPSNNSSFQVGSNITLSANASDNGSISKVNFRVNGNFFKQDNNSPYSVSWSPSSAGTYTIDAVAYDNQNNKTTSSGITINVTAGGNSNGNIVHITKRSASGFALDGGNGGANGQNVVLWAQNSNNVNQRWVEIDRGGGFYSYQKVNTNFCLDGGIGGANGQTVKLWTCNNGNQNQQWKKISTSDGHYRLQKRNATNFCIFGGSGGANGQDVRLATCDNTWNQQYLFNTVGNSNTRVASGFPNNSPILEDIHKLNKTKKFLIYPNPVNDRLNIDIFASAFEVANFSVIDISGRAILKNKITSSHTEIATEMLEQGMYMLELNIDGKISKRKLIVE